MLLRISPNGSTTEGKFHMGLFVSESDGSFDPETLDRVYKENADKRNPLYLFVRGDSYKL